MGDNGAVTTTNRATKHPVHHSHPTNLGRDPETPDQAAPQAAPVDADVVPYTVKKGDTLAELAKRCDTTVDELVELNPALKARTNALRVGEMLDVPAADKMEQKPRVEAEVQTSSRMRAMSGEQAMRTRLADAYVPAPSLDDVKGGAHVRRGMKGESVSDLQKKLNDLGQTPPLVVDGKFGPKTEAALKDCQADHHIQQTGVLGPTTWNVIEKAKPSARGDSGPPGSTGSGGTRGSGRSVPIDGVTPSPLAARIADAAERAALAHPTIGKCALGVNNALSANGVAGRGHAYQKAEQLARNGKFKEVAISRDQLDNLPRGAVVVWGRSQAKPYGHVTVALGDGREASDHVQRMIMGGRYGTDFGNGPDSQGRQFRVFIPVG